MSQNPFGLTFGTDPEYFGVAADASASDPLFLNNGVFAVPPAALETIYGFKTLGGTDKHPVYIDEKDFKVIGDGVAFEVNLTRPHTRWQDLLENVKQAEFALANWLKEFGLTFYQRPVTNFNYARWWTDEYMANERMMWATIFGCDPDMDAFNTAWSCTISDVKKHPFRYGGGHIHISGCQWFHKAPLPTVKLLASTVGMYYVAHSVYPEEDILRANYYGKPGKYRLPVYGDGTEGIEYRSPSVTWTSFHPDQVGEMFSMIDKAVWYLNHSEEAKRFLAEVSGDVQNIFKTFDREAALAFLSRYGS